MGQHAQRIAQAQRTYSGTVTDPTRWPIWVPRVGDVLVCTPAKCGTTWTQSIIAMLLHGGPDLPAPVPVISPWIDSDLEVPAEQVQADLERQTGRRVLKTHTPADGLALWDGVPIVAVYRHPLDVFLSLRNHISNRNQDLGNHPMLRDPDGAFEAWVSGGAAEDDIDRDTLASLVLHYDRTALSDRVRGLILLHYADMMADRAGAVTGLAEQLQIDISPAGLEAVIAATGFDAMKDNAKDFAPVAGTGFWKSDKGFFASGGTEKWRRELSDDQIARFETRLAQLVPNAEARRWLLEGTGAANQTA